MINSWLNGIGVAVALALVYQGISSPRKAGSLLALPTICAMAYVALMAEWGMTGMSDAIGDLRDIAWSLVEIGFMIGLLGIIRDYQKKVVTLQKQVDGLLERMKREGLRCREHERSEADAGVV